MLRFEVHPNRCLNMYAPEIIIICVEASWEILFARFQDARARLWLHPGAVRVDLLLRGQVRAQAGRPSYLQKGEKSYVVCGACYTRLL